jgi:heptosyltransferase-1
VQGPPRFELQAPARDLSWLPAGPYVVLLHATSRAEKLWPQDRWIALGVALAGRGYSLVLPWGSDAERQAAQRLVDAIRQQTSVSTPNDLSSTVSSAAPSTAPSTEPSAESSTAPASPAALLAPKLSLADCARLLVDAAAVVGVDTGLTHLAAALACPTVALFAATEAWRYGPYWSTRAISLGSAGNWPQVPEVLQTLDSLGACDAPGALA